MSVDNLVTSVEELQGLYGAPMPYSLHLTDDGVSIHSSMVENGYASHGCIGTPDAFAAKLFAIAKVPGAGKDGGYMVYNGPRKLAHADTLEDALRVFDRKLRLLLG